MAENFHGLILAAGKGTRLRPATEFCPKPLIPVAGIEPLFFCLFRMQELGFHKVFVNIHFLGEKIRKCLKEWQPLFPKLEIVVSDESEKILGSAGATRKLLRAHASDFKDHGLLVFNGDVLFDLEVERLLEAKENHSFFAFSKKREHLEKYRPLWIDQQMKTWTGIGKTPPTAESEKAHLLSFYSFSPEALWFINEKIPWNGEEIDLFNGIYRPLSNALGAPSGVEYFEDSKDQEFWFDLTNQEFLLEAQEKLFESFVERSSWRSLLEARYPGIVEAEKGVWVYPKSLASTSSFKSPALLVDLRPQKFQAQDAFLGSYGPNAATVLSNGFFRKQDADRKSHQVKNSLLFLNGCSEKKDDLKLPSENSVQVL